MLALRTTLQNRTKVPTPLCGTQAGRLRARLGAYRHNPTPPGEPPILDKK
jgi:hypothetical protein